MREVVTRVQRTFCVYDQFSGKVSDTTPIPNPPPMCDCEYGANNIGGHGEQGNGCPEMREIAALLGYMKEKEYKAILRRAEKKYKKQLAKMNKEWEKKRKAASRA